MSDPTAYLFVVLGVLTAVVIPILRGIVMKDFPPSTAGRGLPKWVKQYGALFVLSLLGGVVALAVWKSGHPNEAVQWYTAFLIGFSFEAALEKAARPA